MVSNMKKLTTAALALVMGLCTFGCAPDKQEEPIKEELARGESAVKTEPEAPEQESNADATSFSFENEAPANQGPYIAEGGWTYIESVGGNFVNYALMLKCTDTVNCYVLMDVSMTARAADGSILAARKDTVQFIAPNDVMPSIGSIPDLQEKPASIEFELSFDPGAVPGNAYTLADFAISNTSEIIGETSTKWTGEYTNNTGVAFPAGVYPQVILRSNGKIVGGSDSSMDNRASESGDTLPFEVTELKGAVPEHDSFELYIVPNLIF